MPSISPTICIVGFELNTWTNYDCFTFYWAHSKSQNIILLTLNVTLIKEHNKYSYRNGLHTCKFNLFSDQTETVKPNKELEVTEAPGSEVIATFVTVLFSLGGLTIIVLDAATIPMLLPQLKSNLMDMKQNWIEFKQTIKGGSSNSSNSANDTVSNRNITNGEVTQSHRKVHKPPATVRAMRPSYYTNIH